MPDPAGDLLFAGLKVLDVATWIAGPVAATILADLGADVIKVEQPGVGDPYRQWAARPMNPTAPANFAWITDARNKRSLTLNLRDPEAKQILLRLVREADVYVTNMPLPSRRAFGLTYEDLAPLNERLIYASVTGYGEEGPDALEEAFDGVAWWTRSALADLVREPDTLPGLSVPGMGDHPTAVSLYAAIVTALLRRERTGKGSHVRTNLLHNGVWANTCMASAAFVDGVDFSPMNAPRPPALGRGWYEAADGRLLQLYMVRTQAQIDALLIAAEAFDILDDERFSTAEAQQQHMEEFAAALHTLFKQRPAAEWLRTFRAAGVPVTHVATLADLSDDEQLRAAGVVAPPADPLVGARLVINHPVTVEDLPRAGALPAPECGEHTDEILAEIGLTAEHIRDLHDRGAV